MEIGWDQAAPVTELFGEAGYREITVTRDMAGLNRVVRASGRERERRGRSCLTSWMIC